MLHYTYVSYLLAEIVFGLGLVGLIFSLVDPIGIVVLITINMLLNLLNGRSGMKIYPHPD